MVTATEAPSRGAQPLWIGHSHARTVARGAASIGQPIDCIDLWDRSRGRPIAMYEDATQTFSDALVERLRAHQGPVYSLVGGNAHVMIGTLRHPRPFDFVLPSEPDLPLEPGAEVVPSGAIRAVLEKLVRPFGCLMTEIAQLCDGPLFHIEPPPPSEGSKRMKPTLPWWLFPGMVREITPPLLRYKLWRLHSEVLESICRPLGMEFVPVPAEGKSPRGYLKGMYFEDGFHGNDAYGALIYEHMRDRK